MKANGQKSGRVGVPNRHGMKCGFKERPAPKFRLVKAEIGAAYLRWAEANGFVQNPRGFGRMNFGGKAG